jgi:ADP-ribose pyrophosphatase
MNKRNQDQSAPPTTSRPAPHTVADVEILGRATCYQGFFSLDAVSLRHRLFCGGWSQPMTRELFVRGPAVGVLLYDPRHRLVGLVEQFRVGALTEPGGPWVLEVVAGMAEPDEDFATVARRETLEEAGIEQLTLEPICRYLVSPGGTDETLTLFCGLTDLHGREGCFGLAHEHEDIRLHVMSEVDALAALAAGRYNNAATIVCLQWLALNRDRLHGLATTGPRDPEPVHKAESEELR